MLKRSKRKLQLGLDLQGGVGFTLEAELGAKTAGLNAEEAQKEKLSKAIEIISARINSFGVAEPLIRAVGANRIEVQLPNINTKDNPEVLENVKKPARLDFRMVDPDATPATVAPGEVPPGYEVKTLDRDGSASQGPPEELFVKRIPEMTGEMVANSFVRHDMYGKPEIDLNFTSEGKKRFADVTRAIADEGRRSGHLGRLAIVLDGTLYSAPTVREEISGGDAVISGNFTDREAIDLANVLNNPLDVPLIVKEQYEVGPSLAKDAVSSGVRASVIALAAVAAFMVTFYATGGVVAVLVGLAVNLLIILGVMSNLGATMTLPGLAGIVLTVGMAVDANILIFERMREELAVGKSLSNANQMGYSKALMTIIDAHVVQLIICAIMIWLGTGPIRGFGVTLAIGVLSTMFSVLITVHLVMELLIDSGWIRKITFRRLIEAHPRRLRPLRAAVLHRIVADRAPRRRHRLLPGPPHLRDRLLGRRPGHPRLQGADRRCQDPAGGRARADRRNQHRPRERPRGRGGPAEDRDAGGQVRRPRGRPAGRVSAGRPGQDRRKPPRGLDRTRDHAKRPQGGGGLHGRHPPLHRFPLRVRVRHRGDGLHRCTTS